MSTENLYNQEAIEKLKKIIDQTDIGILTTYPRDSDYIHAVPMSRQEVDEEGNIYL
ncbi:pyridoxamine 5'-phosphate oxidase family protein [Sphingobacterium phlebotomi]|uniref:pyridoxamine 5'-phosphate oxidase family protein n=1 Tax=Sphingobacterium phlebotomi TaxID=2605433 RepID=UPI001653AAEB|nr:pyridoxamine 5'-phosphate oxidase family protein [Sphingobacterium phlebotomi]